MYFTIFILIFNSFIPNTLEKDTCTSSYFCNDCDFCGASTNNFTSCFYYHMLCKKDYNSITYSTFMKNSLINFFKNDLELTTFCGKKEFKFENNIDEIIIFNSQNKSFPKDKYIHCHYSITNLDITKNENYLYYDLLKNEDSKEPRNLKFKLSNIYKQNNTESIGTWEHDELRRKKSPYTYLDAEKEVEIFLDFLELNYSNPEEILRIRLVREKNPNLFYSSSSSSNGLTIGGAIVGSILLIIIFCIIYYCCKDKNIEPCTTPTNTTTKEHPYVIETVPGYITRKRYLY